MKSTINWLAAQQRMVADETAVGNIDGVFGRMTMTALLSHATGRQPSAFVRELGSAMARHLPEHGITETPERLAEFIAQTCHETGGYQRFAENMCYSAKRMVQIWPGRFPTLVSAQPFAWDPSDPDREDVELANKVYGGRMGNEANGTADNDGWDNRGGGLLQHTGAAEYGELEKLGITSDDVHGGDAEKMVIAACSYWDRRNVNAAIDAKDFALSRRRVNGGVIGLAEIAGIRNQMIRILR